MVRFRMVRAFASVGRKVNSVLNRSSRRRDRFDELSHQLEAVEVRQREVVTALEVKLADVELRLSELIVRLGYDAHTANQLSQDELLRALDKRLVEASAEVAERDEHARRMLEAIAGLGPWAQGLAGIIDQHLYAVLTDSGIRPLLRLAALADLQERYGFAQGLTAFERKVTSQNGEDGVLLEILSRIGASTRYFVEFGASDGTEGNCVLLADVAGWRGLFVESSNEDFARLDGKYANNSGVRTVQALMTSETVEDVFRAADVPEEFDVLSVDIDGADYWVWEAISSFRPRVVIIEHNSALDANTRLVQPRDLTDWDKTEFFGASLGALADLGDAKGYRLVHVEMSGLNTFFVRSDLVWDAEEPIGRSPNYLLVGMRHPPDTMNRKYTDVTNRHAPAGETTIEAELA
jgi:hypothetical protein